MFKLRQLELMHALTLAKLTELATKHESLILTGKTSASLMPQLHENRELLAAIRANLDELARKGENAA